MKRKLIVLASALLLAAIALPTTLKADMGDPPPNCGASPSSCQKPGIDSQFVR